MNLKNVISYILITWLIISTLGENCDDIKCSNIFDEVCGIAELKDHTHIKLIFQNVCLMKKAECKEESFVEVYQVDNELCDLPQRKIARPRDDENQYQGRRVTDFTIIGAHQVCNHSCPTFCTDVYSPACAQIWRSSMQSGVYRTMINHCHIDLFSCTTGVNVTIHPLGKCYQNPSTLLFMQSVAAMKSLRLLDAEHHSRRRANEAVADEDIESSLKTHLIFQIKREIVRRIFDKYRISLDQDESQ